ncbi:hypothetical protein Hanom_Chr12g01155761 [Helianthus anomalus]
MSIIQRFIYILTLLFRGGHYSVNNNSVPIFGIFKDRYFRFGTSLIRYVFYPTFTYDSSTFGTGTHFWRFSGSVLSVPTTKPV